MTKLYYGGYGHHPSGKEYVYYGSDNYRTGQNVVAPVTNKQTGKTYNTMFTITRTSKETSPMAKNEVERLYDQGIDIKNINGRGIMQLPGAYDWKTQSQWQEWSDLVYQEDIDNRLRSFVDADLETKNNAIARNRLLGE